MSFDTQLKDRLDSAASSMPGEPLDLRATLATGRRSRRVYRMVAAAAAAVVLVAGGVIVALTIGGSEKAPDGKVIGPEPGVTRAEAFDATAGFIAAVNLSGDRKIAEMWALLSPVSQAYFDNDIARFDPMDITGETVGAYDFATGRKMHLFFLDRAETMGVVTVTGTVTREAFTEQDGIALPIRVVDGDVKIEYFSGVPYPAARVPSIESTMETLARDSTFAVEVPGDPREVQVAVWEWSSPEPTATGTAAREGGSWSWTPDEPLTPGTYVVTFAVISKSGALAATAEPFVVE